LKIMPKIHQKQLDLIEKEQKIEIKHYFAALKLEKFADSCVCGHLIISHRENGECCHNLTGLCNCKCVKPVNFELIVEITRADMFEFDVRDHSERNSLNYYSEYNLWELKNDKKL